jgi:hypothetical protein
MLRHPNRVLMGALTLGICADYFFNGRSPGISVPLFVILLVALLIGVGRSEGHMPSRANLWVAGTALCFALGLVLRTTPLLVLLDLLVVLGLIFLLFALYRGTGLRHLPLRRMFGDTFRAMKIIGFEPAPLIAHGMRSMPRARLDRLLPVGRGLLLAVPVVVCFGGLLMSADEVFASYVLSITDLPFLWSLNLTRWFWHLLFVSVATYVCAGLLLTALTIDRSSPAQHLTPGDVPAEGDTQRLPKPRRFLGFTEALTVLVAIDVLFGSFMAVQARYLFGGIQTLERTTMTYAQYARRGFFELLVVTCLALGLLWTLAYLTQRIQTWKQRAFNSSSAVLIFLMLGLLASAFQRLLLYEDAFGYTRLRLYTHSFMIWLAIILPIFLVALWRNRFRWFASASMVTALMYLALLNIVNTEALIVQENIRRYQTTGKIDVEYLRTLSSDATPALVAGLDRLDVSSRERLDRHLKQELERLQADVASNGWPSWNLARAQALAALLQRYGGDQSGRDSGAIALTD